MIAITVLYPAGTDVKFDESYYLEKHMPLVEKLWTPLGLTSSKVLKGKSKPDGSPPDYLILTLLTFNSMDDFKAAGKAHGKEIFADIPNFTNSKAVTHINEVLV
jgi:uncharacterized protein (TIGR02118 family)